MSSCECRDPDKEVVDLRKNKTTAMRLSIGLLENPSKWRKRAVERIDLTSASFAERKKSIECAPLRDVLNDIAGYLPRIRSHHKRAKLWLPIGNFPKGPLIDFDLRIAEEPGFLLTKDLHSEIHANRILRLARTARITTHHPTLEVALKEIFGFTTGLWQNIHGNVKPEPEPMRELILRFLNAEGIYGWADTPLTPLDIYNWWYSSIDFINRSANSRMVATIDNAAAVPLLALPAIAQTMASNNTPICNRNDVSAILDLLKAFLEDAKQKTGNKITGEERAANKIEILYASYGDHWDAISECEVPLDEPFMIKTSETRGLHLGSPGEVANSFSRQKGWVSRKSSSQLVVWKDAKSNHVNIRVKDANVELVHDGVKALSERHEVINELPKYFESTPEFLGFYDTRNDRHFRLWIDLPLTTSTPTKVSRWVILSLASTALIAFGFFALHWFGVGNATMSGADVAVILVPSAIAASLLLVREASTLSTELTKEWSIGTAAVLVLLWLGTLIAYGSEKISWGGA